MSWGSASLGSRVWGSVLGIVLPEGIPWPLTITVAGKNLTSYLRGPPYELTIKMSIKDRTTADFALIDLTGALKNANVVPGAPVAVSWHGSRVFGGSIDRVTVTEVGASRGAVYSIECLDYSEICNRHLVAYRYDANTLPPGQNKWTLRKIVKDIVYSRSADSEDEMLSVDGIQALDENIPEGPVIESASFRGVSASKAFDDLSDLTGYSWYVDQYKRLHFIDPKSTIAPFNLLGNTWLRFRNFSWLRSRENYRNVQRFFGGNAKTPPRTEEFAGNGTDRSWEVVLPVAEKPRIWVNRGSGYAEVDPAKIATRKQEKEEGYLWYYSPEDTTISQDPDDQVLTAAHSLKVEYKGLYPIVLEMREEPEIAARQAVEQGSGIYVDAESDEDIDDMNLAIEAAEKLLARNGHLLDEVKFETDVSGWLPGQSFAVDQSLCGAIGNYIVTAVDVRYVADIGTDEMYTRWTITAQRDLLRGGYAEFYERLADSGRPMKIREDDEVNLLRSPRSYIGVGSIMSISEPEIPWEANENRAIINLAKIGMRRLHGSAYKYSGPFIC